MKIVLLYRYTRPDGGTTMTLNKPDCAYTTAYRIIADPGKALTTDGKSLCPCVDVDDPAGWYEVDAPEENGGDV